LRLALAMNVVTTTPIIFVIGSRGFGRALRVRTTISYSAGAATSFGGREIASVISAATTQSAPATKNAGR
jgi:hypothetical protein